MQNFNSHSTADSIMEDQALGDIVSLTNEDRDRKQFAQEIHKFMSEIGKPLSKIPIMGYKELDLYQLYREVTAHGGFNEVVKNVGTWSKIWKRLGNFDPSITDSSFRLKKNYERYLLDYEFKCFPEHRLQALEFQEKSSLKRSTSASNIHMASMSRPHSPTSHFSSSSVSSPSFSLNNSNTSSGIFHNSPESSSPLSSRKKSTKAKKRLSRSSSSTSGSRTPSRSNSYNNIASLGRPLVFGELTVECLGNIIPRYPYIVENQIYPIGFVSHRNYTSRLQPDRQVRYTSMIVDAGDHPQFIVVAADEPDQPIISNESPSVCWKMILQHFMDTDDHNATPVSQKISVSGKLRYGLTHPDVAALIRELPNADKAQDLFPPMSPSKRKYHYISDDSADEAKKAQRSSFSTRNVSRDEMHDLESAIATLHALKYCSVF